MWRPEDKALKKFDQSTFGLELADTNRTQMLKTELITLLHWLDINCSNIESIRQGLRAIKRRCGRRTYATEEEYGKKIYATEEEYEMFDNELEELSININKHRVRVKHLIERADNLLVLLVTLVGHPAYTQIRRGANVSRFHTYFQGKRQN